MEIMRFFPSSTDGGFNFLFSDCGNSQYGDKDYGTLTFCFWYFKFSGTYTKILRLCQVIQVNNSNRITVSVCPRLLILTKVDGYAYVTYPITYGTEELKK